MMGVQEKSGKKQGVQQKVGARLNARTQRGFSFIELAVGMLILAMLLGSLLVPLRTRMEQRDIARTQETLEHIREALYGFAMSHGRLPRPAQSEIDGRENPKECAEEKDCSGFLPWTTLGVPRADAWGKLYMYSVTAKFSRDQPELTFADSGAWTLKTRLSGNPMQLTDLAERVVAVVYSFGAKNFGRSEHMTNIANLALGNIDEIFNSGAEKDNPPTRQLVYRYRASSTSEDEGTGGQFDDQFVWLPTSVFMSRMVEAHRLP